MVEFLKEHQLNIMLFMSGICAILAFLTIFTGTLSAKRRRILASLEIAAMFLLLMDRFAYIYRGDVSDLGWWMVRISNFLVFFLSLFIPHVITLYLYDLYRNEGKMKTIPKRLWLCEVLFTVGAALLVISQFTGLYYTFDSMNQYQRAPGFIICYIMPFLIIILQQSVVIQYRKLLSRPLLFSLILNTVVPVIAAVLQIFMYGVSLTNMTTVGLAVLLYVYALVDLNQSLERARKAEIESYKEAHRHEHALFEQTAEALVNAIDAKDTYTRGHSSRVALYSQQIAREAGMSDEECERIYFAGLLHDVGKIGVPDVIINKKGRLTDEEYAEIKKHPVYGNQILSSIQQSPYLSIGAHYHHERYDGKGYPDGLIGDDIPEIARIIAVADAYDAMTSMRSYRDTVPQQKVREELFKGMGTQFDAKYAKIMLHLIDLDLEYQMRERAAGGKAGSGSRLRCDSIYNDCTMGALITDHITRMSFYCRSDDGFTEDEAAPCLILFDSLDGRVHVSDERRKDLLYFEYAKLRFNGQSEREGARKIETDEVLMPEEDQEKSGAAAGMKYYKRYDVEAVHIKDHAMINISDGKKTLQSVIALPDSVRFMYISLTGEHCMLTNIHIVQEEDNVAEDHIPRIAEEISYIKDCPEGDIPNIEVDGWCEKKTQGIPLDRDLRITFHTKSLPTARLVWHCPYVSIYTSEDGAPYGDTYREYILTRLDGENWESDEYADNKVIINRTDDFDSWTDWKEKNKAGFDCEVLINRDGNTVTITTENFGISIRSITTIKDDVDKLYVALTGDQVALTDIHVK